MYTDEQLTFCEEIPKLELHAHLNGSIRDETIRSFSRTEAFTIKGPESLKTSIIGADLEQNVLRHE